jgi:hypothetical protein
MFDNFEPWVSIPDQGKLLKKSTYLKLRAYLGWSIETCCLISSQYRNIVDKNIVCDETKSFTVLYKKIVSVNA